MNQIKLAWKIANRAHRKQKRYNGQPYINHIKEVVSILEKMEINALENEHIIVGAILHDVVEDGGQKYENIIEEEFNNKVIQLVQDLTHRGFTTYNEYIRKIRFSTSGAIVVKIADMIHNLTETPTKKQREKYGKYLPLLIKSLLNED